TRAVVVEVVVCDAAECGVDDEYPVPVAVSDVVLERCPSAVGLSDLEAAQAVAVHVIEAELITAGEHGRDAGHAVVGGHDVIDLGASGGQDEDAGSVGPTLGVEEREVVDGEVGDPYVPDG